jgi:hypothetical protein
MVQKDKSITATLMSHRSSEELLIAYLHIFTYNLLQQERKKHTEMAEKSSAPEARQGTAGAVSPTTVWLSG